MTTHALKNLSASTQPRLNVSSNGNETIRVDLGWIRTGLDDAAASSGKTRVEDIKKLLDRLHTQQQAAGRLRP